MLRKTIRDALKPKESGAILTTHYMEEAEAVCDRVAILVSGQLRWVTAPGTDPAAPPASPSVAFMECPLVSFSGRSRC